MTTATLDIKRRAVRIPVPAAMLEAEIMVPSHARGVVLFANESNDISREPRLHSIAAKFNDSGMATVLTNLLTAEETRLDSLTREMRFDVALLSRRLISIIDWIPGEADIGRLPLGLFGAHTGSSAALEAAARRPAVVHAVVSRSGRPDLADHLDLVRAPVLLIAGGADAAVLELNRHALHHLHSIRQLEIISGATHQFEEWGAMDRVAQLAEEWFARYVASGEEEW
jgi:dienelactone hydrolase